MAAALPTLLAGIRDTEDLVRMNAALGIGYLDLESVDNGLKALGEMEPGPPDQLSRRFEHLTHFVDPNIRRPALAALSKINPTGVGVRRQ